ncbi:VWA domain-containing protein [Aciditerrimonas ferrireducens]|uniref:VWA domain-containing protein n=1 Tax=Aciditerrimonas ferrireducens TaxID=667306 RepID=UPI002899E8B4|nr:VWA domain-containing protein [Aciditerrimonas ferrireducens]
MNAPGAPPSAPSPSRYPLSALVGQEELRLALLLCALDPAIGGVLVRGDKGSGKTTAARALAGLLPGAAPFVELPVGAGEDRLVGTVDLRGLLHDGRPRFVPGLLQQAHGGVLYVDEVNLLPDHLVDVLLDVAASGVNVVERDGVSHRHPARFVLVGSMNPEEGELRPQFLDRFGLVVNVAAPEDPAARAEAVERRLAFDADPTGFVARWQAEEGALARRLQEARPARPGPGLSHAVARLCLLLGVEGLRGDLVCLRAAAALAGLEGREEAGPGEVRRVAGLALGHRRRRSPFDPPGIDPEELARALDEVFGPEPPADPPDPAGAVPPRSAPPPAAKEAGPAASAEPGPAPEGSPAGTPDGTQDPVGTPDGTRGAPEGPGASLPLSGGRPLGLLGASALGRRPGSKTWARPVASAPVGRRGGAAATSPAPGGSGRVVGATKPTGPVRDLAPVPSVQAAAARGARAVAAEDLRVATRRAVAPRLVVLAVDCSGSMGAAERLAAAGAVAEGLLVEAYQRRDRLAVVTFGGAGAEVAVAPTSSLEVARARLAQVVTGGRTPLGAGLRRALAVALEGRRRGQRPGLVVVSDGRATAGSAGQDPVAEAFEAAEAVRAAGVASVVVDVEEPGPARLGLAGQLAARLGAAVVPGSEALPEALATAVAQVEGGW